VIASRWLRRPEALFLVALSLIVLLAYWPGLNGGFVFDDYPNIVENVPAHLQSLAPADVFGTMFSSPASDIQRPLAMLSFGLNHLATGLDPWWMKATNIAIHLLNTLLLFGLLRSLCASLPGASDADAARYRRICAFVTAAWALAPINLMAVLFIVQRMESLCQIFVLGGLWMYVAGRQRQWRGQSGRWWIASGIVGGTALGVLSKESAVLLPLYAASAEFVLFRARDAQGGTDRRLFAFFAIVLVLPALAGVAWLLPKMVDPLRWVTRDFDLTERLLTEPRVLMQYLSWTVVPDLGQLSLYHDDYPISRGWTTPATTLPAMVALALIAVVSVMAVRRRPLLALGLQWFLGAQLLTATFIPLELVFEHRNYFGSIGVFLVLADLLLTSSRPQRRRFESLAATGLVLIYAGLTHLRAHEWSDPIRFAFSEAAKHPQSPRATYALAHTLIALQGYRTDGPLAAETLTALQTARRIPGGSILADHALLVYAARTGMPLDEAWWQDLRRKLAARPVGAQDVAALRAMTDCVIAEHCVFPTAQMIETFTTALTRHVDARVLDIYGNYALNALGETRLTLALWTEAIERDPREVEYRVSLGRLLVALGRIDAARAQIAAIRKAGRFGQYAGKADELERRIEARESTLSPTPQ
jgi:tetratricopeptide (TPR) repeat protein